MRQLWLPLVACGAWFACEPYRLPASDPCSLENPDRVAFVAECDARIAECPRDSDGRAVATCPALLECEAEQARVCG